MNDIEKVEPQAEFSEFEGVYMRFLDGGRKYHTSIYPIWIQNIACTYTLTLMFKYMV